MFQVSNQECSALACKLESSRREAVELRSALEATIKRHEQQEGVVKELASIVEQQKYRLQVVTFAHAALI